MSVNSILLMECTAEEAREHFLKASSYLNSDLPSYLSFEPILQAVSNALDGQNFLSVKHSSPNKLDGVNYKLLNNKDGRFAWRQYEIIHPVIYVSLVNTICKPENWAQITARMAAFGKGAVECCSLPVISTDHQSDKAAQISSWWQRLEQETLKCSLNYSHILHTDVTDCYGSIYTHSIAWALHGKTVSKKRDKDSALGRLIDQHVMAGRYGQTNGIPQGSVLMDFIAELVLGYVDERISEALSDYNEDYRILRYRDDYRILANSDTTAEHLLKVVSDCLREVGMRLGAAKTSLSASVVENAVKPDKLAGIGYYDSRDIEAENLQKKLLHLHGFGRRYPNSGALKRLLARLQDDIVEQKVSPRDLDVQIAIAADIAVGSPSCIPIIASILSYLMAFKTDHAQKSESWDAVLTKLGKIPYNGYLEIWLQRVTKPSNVAIDFNSDEAICKIVNGEEIELWISGWISSPALKKALDARQIVVSDPEKMDEKMSPEETKLFKEKAFSY